MDRRLEIFDILCSARMLQALPDVRRRALIESVRRTETAEGAIDVLLENLSSSPYIPQERKDQLAELAMTQQFAALRTALMCDPPSLSSGAAAISEEEEFRAFRQMVVAVFTRSRKMAALSAERRWQLGSAIHSQRSADDIKMLALSALETSQAFDGEARDMVANDIFDNRFDRLLLPNRFDCDEIPRRAAGRGAAETRAAGVGTGDDGVREGDEGASASSSSAASQEEEEEEEEELECPICLGTNPVGVRLPCKHMFCRTCVEGWAQRCSDGPEHAECPLCRGSFALSTDLTVI